MVLEITATSVLVGLLRGGKLSNLAHLRLRGLSLFMAALTIQWLLVRLSLSGYSLVLAWQAPIYLSTFALLLIACWLNRQHRPVILCALGIFANALVVALNGGKMPVLQEPLAQILGGRPPCPADPRFVTHTLVTPETRLVFLADIIYLPPPYPSPGIFSLGDVLLAIGAFLLIQKGMLKPH